jgi:hypothetical protein
VAFERREELAIAKQKVILETEQVSLQHTQAKIELAKLELQLRSRDLEN